MKWLSVPLAALICGLATQADAASWLRESATDTIVSQRAVFSSTADHSDTVDYYLDSSSMSGYENAGVQMHGAGCGCNRCDRHKCRKRHNWFGHCRRKCCKPKRHCCRPARTCCKPKRHHCRQRCCRPKKRCCGSWGRHFKLFGWHQGGSKCSSCSSGDAAWHDVQEGTVIEGPPMPEAAEAVAPMPTADRSARLWSLPKLRMPTSIWKK